MLTLRPEKLILYNLNFMKKLFTLLSLTTALLINAKSPYISKVYDFVPAPGQFVNAMPEYEEGDDKASMLLKVEEQICGDKNPGMISLGAWGGYVVFGFDHPVVNVEDQYDFKIYGNAFIGNQATSNGGSCEPGIVLVSYDENGNGMPDDKWYELARSEYAKESTIHDYKLTYYKPEANHEAQSSADDPHIIDVNYIKWTDNKGGQGYVEKNVFNWITFGLVAICTVLFSLFSIDFSSIYFIIIFGIISIIINSIV